MADEYAGQPDGLEDDAYDGKAKSSKSWLTMIADAEKIFRAYHDKSDNIDKLYANLERMADPARDRQMAIFWANIQVIAPSIYSRPPIPVVVPRFKDRKPLPRAASEMLERVTVVTFELEDIDATMRLIRDDLTRLARGAVWLRYEAADRKGKLSEKVCIDHCDRRDFLHDPQKKWKPVDWVAYRAWLTKSEARKRFKKTSGDAYKDAAYEKRKDDKESDDGRLKAGFWELWCKSENKVVWVTEGVDVELDAGPPHLTLDGFFPCPRPAYATLQPGSMIPVPDMVFYKDQLEEINELTARISALTDAVKVRGFYPAGAGEIGDAIEAAIKSATNNQMLVPIANWAMIGSGGVKDMIVWLPLDMIATTITQLVELRKQLIDDVYQITGLSDIMRGSTVASETLGAQQLKSQYGSIRIRDRQDELVRVARDITRIAAEIMAENFQPQTLMEMSQLEIPTEAVIAQQIMPLQQQIAQITAQIQKAQQDPRMIKVAQANPQQAQQIIQQAQQEMSGLQQQIQRAQQTPTVEKVTQFLRDQRLRPFVLDIETDSTIAPDENATKQRATEFITAVGGFMAQAIPLVEQVPQAATLASEMLKFTASQFRAGRDLQGTIEEFADQMKQMASQPKPDPMKAKADAEAQAIQQQTQATAQDAAISQKAAQEKIANDNQAHAQKMQDGAQEHAFKMETLGMERKQKADQHNFAMELTVTKHIQPEQAKPAETDKGPSESISYKDIPPEAQAQMLEQAGIHSTPAELADHAKTVADAALKAKQAAKPQAQPA